jgi:cysteine desulfurase/selenocysteine lyase
LNHPASNFQVTDSVRKVHFDVEQVREDFPILGRSINGSPLTYLDSGASSQKPKQVIDRVSDYYTREHANIHRGVHHLSQQATQAYEDAREIIRCFLNAQHSHEVLFTKGTTDGINLVASSFGRKYLQAGDEVIISTMEHHSNIVPWQMICEERGAKVRVIPINRAGELDMAAYAELLNDRTKLVAVVHVSNTLGTINPVQDIISLAHQQDIPVLLDGAQAVPHMHVDVQALDVDFYAFSAHKVFGPTGVGILYGKEDLLNSMPPYQGGGDMIEKVTFEKTTYNTLPHKFEAGTPNIADGIAFGAAIEYYCQFDEAEIEAHEQDILEYATGKLEEIEGLGIVGTAAHKACVISFNLEGAHPFDVGTILDQQGIAVRTGHHCTQPLMEFYGIPGTVRASFAMYNNRDDVDALVAGVKRAAKMLL